MATVNESTQRLATLHLTEAEHPCWSGAFDDTVRIGQIDEDLFAARSVSGVLIAIFCTGAFLGALTVIAATLL